MEWKKKLCPSLLEMIKSGDCTSNLVHMFNQVHENLCDHDLHCLFRLFMCAATKYNHFQLVFRLLTDPRCDLNFSLGGVPHPLFDAIRVGDRRIVKLYLHTISTIDVLKQHQFDPSFEEHTDELVESISEPDEYVSAVEFACLYDQPEILVLLVAYDDIQRSTRYD